MRKLISILLVITMVLSMTIPCSAASVTENKKVFLRDEELGSKYGTFVQLTEFNTRGTSAPTEGWNCETQGTLKFSGSASYSTLWLNKLLWGCSCYKVTITNKGSSPLKIDVRGGIDAGEYTVPANSPEPWEDCFRMESTSEYFCITFRAPSNFSGYVSCGCTIGG